MKHIQRKAVLVGAVVLLTASLPVFGAPTYEPPIIGSAIVLSNSLLSVASPANPDRVAERTTMVVTGYSSDPAQTDDTPFITAFGTRVREGIVATNSLPFGTRIRIPSLYGNNIFVVEDRMNERKIYQVDIWFPNSQDAKNFGVKFADVEVLKQN